MMMKEAATTDYIGRHPQRSPLTTPLSTAGSARPAGLGDAACAVHCVRRRQLHGGRGPRRGERLRDRDSASWGGRSSGGASPHGSTKRLRGRLVLLAQSSGGPGGDAAVGVMGNPDVYTPQSDVAPDDANHSEYGVFILYDPAERVRERLVEDLHVTDGAPILLDRMGVPVPEDMEGTIVYA